MVVFFANGDIAVLDSALQPVRTTGITEDYSETFSLIDVLPYVAFIFHGVSFGLWLHFFIPVDLCIIWCVLRYVVVVLPVLCLRCSVKKLYCHYTFSHKRNPYPYLDPYRVQSDPIMAVWGNSVIFSATPARETKTTSKKDGPDLYRASSTGHKGVAMASTVKTFDEHTLLVMYERGPLISLRLVSDGATATEGEMVTEEVFLRHRLHEKQLDEAVELIYVLNQTPYPGVDTVRLAAILLNSCFRFALGESNCVPLPLCCSLHGSLSI